MPAGHANGLYSSIHYVWDNSDATVHDLREVIRTFPIIDNHAHNLLREDEAHGNHDYPFESITSEAQGHALQEHVHSTLAHMRGVKQLAELYQCPATLQDVKAMRYDWVARDYDGLLRRCLEGTHALLIDDGLPQESVYPVQWHTRLVPTATRIVRIESIAAEILEQLAHAVGFLAPGMDADWAIETSEAFLTRFNTMFRNQIKVLAGDPQVRGFKSVICYRSGLDVSLESRQLFRPHQSLTDSPLLRAFHDFLTAAVRDHNYRIQCKLVNDFLVVAACDVLEKLVETEGETLPFQFHTGLGDNDINLEKANPACMQPMIEAFSNVDFVILHSSYPYTRQAGYLAATYANAWLDIGEVFPMLSHDGQLHMLRQAFELTPTSKILWSTDGHFYPETFWLANKQFRTALETVLVEYTLAAHLSVSQAIDIAVDIMFWNSNALYKLDEERKYPQLLSACGRSLSNSRRTTLVSFPADSRSELLHNVPEMDASASLRSSSTVIGSLVPSLSSARSAYSYDGTLGQSSQLSSDVFNVGSRSSTHNQRSSNMATQTAMEQNVEAFEAFTIKHPEVKYIWMQFIDTTGTLRVRMVPIKSFAKHLATRQYPGITKALPRLLQNEWPAAGCSATGEFKIVPDLSSLCINTTIDSPSATVQTWWMLESGNSQLQQWIKCPRWALQRQATSLKAEFGIDILMGFEVEVIFMRPTYNADKSDFEDFQPAHQVHSWSNMTYQQLDFLPMIEEIVDTLASIGIELHQFHAEAAPTQWEFPLPPSEPVQAVDTLYKARDTIRNIARKHGLKATLYPRPFPMAPGSASHAHFSINGPNNTVQRYADPFLAGILAHLPAILAFSLPLEESYARVAAGVWGGGEYVTWGTQNREVPLRKCGPGHWELKTVDGIGNMYFSMAAVLAAGLLGLRGNVSLTIKDTAPEPSSLSDAERQQLGITTKLPNTLQKSLTALAGDVALHELVGEEIVADYIAIKEAEMKLLEGMGKDKRRLWLMARY